MNVMITGRHVGVTPSMKEYARARIEKLLKFWDRVISARVTMDLDHGAHAVEMAIEVSRGHTLVGKASGEDIYAACDLAEQKLAQQLRRHKERLTDHHRGERRDEVDLTVPDAPASAPSEETYEQVIEHLRTGE